MGFLGLCLLFAGIVLIMDGVAAIPKRDVARAAFTNFSNRAAGHVFLMGTIIGFVRAGVPSPAYAAGGA
ncbi:MAG: hypothetical protein LBT00_15785 [Spirochaetaceae bacterium]|jgi:hypothetical protein|nr:hypothetical protein [Spirochaetaceae bacterium]